MEGACEYDGCVASRFGERRSVVARVGEALIISLMVASLIGSASAESFYRWTDEQGVTHFSQSPPSEEQTEVEKSELPTFDAGPEVAPPAPVKQEEPPSLEFPSVPGFLPGNATSRFLQSEGSSIGYRWERGKALATQWLHLKSLRGLPKGAYLEVRFPNLFHPSEPYVVTYVRQGAEENMLVKSPEFEGTRCGTFSIKVDVYRNSTRLSHLDSLMQGIQFRLDTRGFLNEEDFLLGVFNTRYIPCTRNTADFVDDIREPPAPRGIPLSVFRRIRTEMTRDEVEAVAGKPDKVFQTSRELTVWIYGEPGATHGVTRIHFWKKGVRKIERDLH